MGFIRKMTGVEEYQPGPVAQLSCQGVYYDQMRKLWVNEHGTAANRWDLPAGPAPVKMGPYREALVKQGLARADCRGCGAPYEPVCSYCKRSNSWVS